jgi:pimeloyl-ACP methyl ester carboxylesterase
MSQVISKDGTAIAYERLGSGPPVVLVDGAMCSRAFGPMPKIAPLLAAHHTVFMYDRRGRGESTDTQPHAREREIEDLAALVEATGGKPSLLGLSSGAALALEAAASGLPVDKVIAYEPPYVEAEGSTKGTVHHARLTEILAKGDRGGAVKYFMGPMVAVPKPIIFMMQLMPWIWGKLKKVAHTLPYDCAVMGDFVVPRERLSAIRVPTLVMNGSKTTEPLKRAAQSIAGAVPGATHRTLEGQDHNVNAAVLVSAVETFL